jgi:hypothetical protein
MFDISKIEWPEGKDFAFTVFDDTDWGTVENLKPVYDFLYDLGIKTTKSVWPLSNSNKPLREGDTCEDPEYLEWLLDLQKKGFEIGYHLSSYNSSKRERTEEGLEKFKELFGHYPISMANHNVNKEGVYWGSGRLSFAATRLLYNFSTKFARKDIWEGHIKGSPYFWGDICRQKIKYVRNFVFREINTLKACPEMPYADASKPYVNLWYSASEGSGLKSYNQMITPENIDKLVRERGACIMYTHFAAGFYKDNVLNETFRKSMGYLAGKNGWFVPASTLLDYLIKIKGIHQLKSSERLAMELKWLSTKIKRGRTS